MAKMVSRILEQEEALRIVLSADRKTTHLLLTWQDTEILQSLDQALSPLSTLTDILSGESYVTVSAVLPIVNLIDNNLSREKDTDTQLTKDIKQRIRQDITHRYTHTSVGDALEILKVAMFLDPRFKTKYISDEEMEDIKHKLINDEFIDFDTTTSSTPQAEGAQGDMTEVQPPAKKMKKRNLGTLFKDNDESEEQEQMPVISQKQQIRNEL